MTKNIDRHDKKKEVRRCLGERFGCKNAYEIPALVNNKESHGAFICLDCITKYRLNPGMNPIQMWDKIRLDEQLKRLKGEDRRN